MLASALGCASPHEPAPVSQRVHLAAGLAATVGGDEITLTTVRHIAQAQHVAPETARQLAIADALYAAGARAVLQGGSVVPTLERSAWARALLEGLKAEAVARGPATDAEVAELTALHWQDLDRPETVRTSHAVARVLHPEDAAEARSIAQKIYEAVRNVHDSEEFLRVAQSVPHGTIDVRAERLPALTSDGRPYFPEGGAPAETEHFDLDFATAAMALRPSQVSEPVKSVFGYHVILCEARLPELRLSLEERRARTSDEIMKNRANRLKQDLLARLAGATPIPIARSVEALTAQVQVLE